VLAEASSGRSPVAIGAALALAAAIGVAAFLRFVSGSGSRAQAAEAGHVVTPSAPPASPPAVLPASFESDLACAVRCSRLTDSDRQVIATALKQAGCDPKTPGKHVLCATTPEQVCAGSCGSGKQDMASWLPGAFGLGSAQIAEKELQSMARQAHDEYWTCAERCSRERVMVDAHEAGAEDRAVETLQRCGVVQLARSFDGRLLEKVQAGIDELASKKKLHNKLLDQKQLHTGRSQVYLPFSEPFKTRQALGVSDLVHAVLERYFAGREFGIDHVSVLTSDSPCGNQSLHPDIHYFKGLAVSVHTALLDVTRDMGPTYFCPCTGEKMSKEEWPSSAAVKMATLKEKACFGPSFAPSFIPRGTVTIYDGAMFHMGLENLSGRKRPVLKLEVGAEDYPEIRNYIQMAPETAKRHVNKYRIALGPPRMGDPFHTSAPHG